MSSSMENDLLCEPLSPIVKELSSGDSGNMEYQLLIWEVYSLNFKRLEKPLRKEKKREQIKMKMERSKKVKIVEPNGSNGWNKFQCSHWLLKNKYNSRRKTTTHISWRKILWVITCNLSINSTLSSWISYTSLSVIVTF